MSMLPISLLDGDLTDPMRAVADVQRSLSRLFDNVRTGSPRIAGFAADVYETPDEVVVRADLPGVRAEDVHVQYQEGQLSIRATRKSPVPEGASALVRETPSGEFLRVFNLGFPVNAERIQAAQADGVLTVQLPKSEEARPRQIPVRSGAQD
jgi:HSP20 family protein